MRAWADDIPRQQNEIKKQLTTEVITQLIAATPVRRGEARSNYTVGQGNANSEYRSSGWDLYGLVALRAARGAIETCPPGTPLVVSNNAPHIAKLNAGGSIQAPAGFMQQAVEDARRIIGKQVIRYTGGGK